MPLGDCLTSSESLPSAEFSKLHNNDKQLFVGATTASSHSGAEIKAFEKFLANWPKSSDSERLRGSQ